MCFSFFLFICIVTVSRNWIPAAAASSFDRTRAQTRTHIRIQTDTHHFGGGRVGLGPGNPAAALCPRDCFLFLGGAWTCFDVRNGASACPRIQALDTYLRTLTYFHHVNSAPEGRRHVQTDDDCIRQDLIHAHPKREWAKDRNTCEKGERLLMKGADTCLSLIYTIICYCYCKQRRDGSHDSRAVIHFHARSPAAVSSQRDRAPPSLVGCDERERGREEGRERAARPVI